MGSSVSAWHCRGKSLRGRRSVDSTAWGPELKHGTAPAPATAAPDTEGLSSPFWPPSRLSPQRTSRSSSVQAVSGFNTHTALSVSRSAQALCCPALFQSLRAWLNLVSCITVHYIHLADTCIQYCGTVFLYGTGEKLKSLRHSESASSSA